MNTRNIYQDRINCWQLPFVLLLLTTVILAGCSQQPTTDPLTNTDEVPSLEPVNLLIVGDDNLADRIVRQWKARMDSPITTRSISEIEFEDQDYQIESTVDVVIYPAGLIGELTSRDLVSELPTSVWNDDQLNKKDILRRTPTLNSAYARKNRAVPLGSPQLSIVYRTDVLDSIGVKKIPDDWESFDELVLKLADTPSSPDEGTALPSNVEFPLSDAKGQHWAATTFLARVAPYIRHRGKLTTVFDKNDMSPLIASEPFVRALKEMKTSLGGNVLPTSFRTPAEIYDNILKGQTAIGITWPTDSVERPTSGSEGDGQTSKRLSEHIAIAPLPGSIEWFDLSTQMWKERPSDDSHRVDLICFDGLVASVTNSSPHTTSAYKFLTWLPSKQISISTMTRSPRSGPFRASHLGNVSVWTGPGISDEAAQQYGDNIRRTNEELIVFVFPRIPGRDRYLSALNKSVIECLTTDKDALQSLEEAANVWREITTQLDGKKQLAELRRSEGR